METHNRDIDTAIELHAKPELNNQVDKKVQQIFFPLNLMQILLLNPMYHIKNNFIYPNNCFNKFMLVSSAVFFVTIYFFCLLEVMLDDNFLRYCSVNFLIFTSTFEVHFKSFGFIMNSTIHFIYSKKSVLFVLYFQEVHRFLSNSADIKRSIISNWISVASIFMFFFMIVTYDNIFFYKPPWNMILFKLILATQDSNLIYIIRLMRLLTDAVKLWNIQLLLIQRNGCCKLQTVKMFQAYDQILKCYNIVRSIYQVPVSFYWLFCSP